MVDAPAPWTCYRCRTIDACIAADACARHPLPPVRRYEPRRGQHIPTVAITIRIPATLHAQLHALLVNPRTGELPYGTWGRTIESIIEAWVNSQKVHSG